MARTKAPKPRPAPKPKAEPKGHRSPVDADLAPLTAKISSGLSLRKSCEALGLDAPDTHRWLNSDDNRAQQYARAKEQRGEHYEDRALAVTEAAMFGQRFEGKLIDKDGLKLHLDAIKWTVGRMSPKPKVLEHQGPGGGPIEHSHLSPEERQARIAELRAKMDAHED